jgi:hypothetical protein
VSTGAMNDSGQLTICENNIESAVPSAMRRMRTLAILMRLDSLALGTAVELESDGIGQEAGDSNVDPADEVEEPVVA